MLEQIAYQLPRISETKQRVYQVGDLESLSATALHYGEGGGSSGFVGGGFGGISKKDIDKYGIVLPTYNTPSKIQPNQKLTIRNFPASGTQLHIHEEPRGITHFKHSDGTYSEINSYDAAMADGGKPAYDAMKLLEALNKQRKFEEFKKWVLKDK